MFYVGACCLGSALVYFFSGRFTFFQHVHIISQSFRDRFFLQELKELEPDDALALDEDNIRHWLRGHDRLTLPEGGLGRFRPIPGEWERCSAGVFRGVACFLGYLKLWPLELKARTQSKLRCICKRGLTAPPCLQNLFDILETQDMLDT